MSVCGTSTHISSSSFSRQCEFMYFVTIFTPHHHSEFAKQRTSLLFPPRDLARLLHPPGNTILLRPCLGSLAYISGTGISTCFPSATTFVLALGPDLLWVVKPSPENLGHSTALILQRSRYSCRHSLFCTVHHSFRYGFSLYRLLLYQFIL